MYYARFEILGRPPRKPPTRSVPVTTTPKPTVYKIVKRNSEQGSAKCPGGVGVGVGVGRVGSTGGSKSNLNPDKTHLHLSFTPRSSSSSSGGGGGGGSGGNSNNSGGGGGGGVATTKYPTVFAEGREGALLPLVPLAQAREWVRRTCQRWEVVRDRVVCAGGWRLSLTAQVLGRDGRPLHARPGSSPLAGVAAEPWPPVLFPTAAAEEEEEQKKRK